MSGTDAARTSGPAPAYGAPRLQVLYAGAGQGRDPQQTLRQKHHAQVLAHAQPVAADLHRDHPREKDHSDDQPPAVAQQIEYAAVIVTSTAQGSDGWTAPVQTHGLECPLLADPGARLVRPRPGH